MSLCILQFSVVFLSYTNKELAILTIVYAVKPPRLKEVIPVIESICRVVFGSLDGG